jgi:hypothetical protein
LAWPQVLSTVPPVLGRTDFRDHLLVRASWEPVWPEVASSDQALARARWEPVSPEVAVSEQKLARARWEPVSSELVSSELVSSELVSSELVLPVRVPRVQFSPSAESVGLGGVEVRQQAFLVSPGLAAW